MHGILVGISAIVRQFNSFRKSLPVLLAVFLSIGALGANVLFEGAEEGIKQEAILGGPAISDTVRFNSIEQAAFIGQTAGALASGGPEDAPHLIDALNGGDLQTFFTDQGSVISGALSDYGIISYTVQRGDTISEIAARFGISVATILGANPNLRPTSIQPGQTLTILPVSGIIYQVQDGDTPESIARKFDLTVSQIQEFNRSQNLSIFSPGYSLIIPGASPLASSRSTSASSLPSANDYYIRPARGFNWGQLHNNNGIDIANSCGTPVVASAEGLVVPDSRLGDGTEGWNSGYGRFVILEHPNGTKTRYAHMLSVDVRVGDYVEQGERIGAIGNTGNVVGVTGCHLHFEVLGATNPFAK